MKAALAGIMNIAKANEEKGSRFYAKMAGKTDNPKIKAIFEKLSREEIEHRSSFEKMLGLEAENAEEVDEKEGKLLESLVSTSVFQKISEEDVLSPVEALAIGIQAEKDSILLYQEMYSQVRSQVLKNMLSILLEEEKMHLVELREHMEELQAKID
ncbi:MAG: ferritin family protein [Bacillota bacterium]